MRIIKFILLTLLTALHAFTQQADNLDFISGIGEFEHINEMLPSYLKRHAEELLNRRRQQIARITTLADVTARKTRLREIMVRDLGGFPDRTPLNARVTAVLDRGDFKI